MSPDLVEARNKCMDKLGMVEKLTTNSSKCNLTHNQLRGRCRAEFLIGVRKKCNLVLIRALIVEVHCVMEGLKERERD